MKKYTKNKRGYDKKYTINIKKGTYLKCINDKFQHGLKIGEVYIAYMDEFILNKKGKGRAKMVRLEEFRGNWRINRFVAVK